MCVDGLGYVYVCESCVALEEYGEPPSLFVLSVCAYGGVVGYFGVRFLCELCFFIVMMSGCELCTRFFRFLDFVSNAVYVDLKYDNVVVGW